MSFSRSNLEIFTLQIIVFCRFFTIRSRCNYEQKKRWEVVLISSNVVFATFCPDPDPGIFWHMKSRKSLLLESGILALESGIQLKKSRITAWIQNPRLSWIHNKDTADYQKKGAFCQMWKSFLCGRFYDADIFLTSSRLKQQSSHCIFTRCFTQIMFSYSPLQPAVLVS